MAVKVI